MGRKRVGHSTIRCVTRAPLVVVVAWLAVVGLGGCAGDDRPADGLRVGVAYQVGGAADPVNALTRRGITAAGGVGEVRELGADAYETDGDRYDRLILLCRSGYDPVLAVGAAYAGPDPATGPLARAAKDCPGTRFASVDDASVSEANLADLAFAHAEGAYLAGEAAALNTHSGVVGFVGGCAIPAVQSYEAGYRAGVAAARPGTTVHAAYLATDPTRCGPGFGTAELAREAARGLYAGGADVLFQVAGAAGNGVLLAAQEQGALMVNSVLDPYRLLGPNQQLSGAEQAALLTSDVEQVDLAVKDFVAGVAGGHFTAGVHLDNLASGRIGYSSQGPHMAPLVPRLDADKAKIINGEITVPNAL